MTGQREHDKDRARVARGPRRLDDLRVSWLDFKLGFRMLVRYPGLTVVGGLAMAFAIWVGAGTFELVTQVLRPRLPLPDGDRIVALQHWDAAASRPEFRSAYDFAVWRSELRSVRDLGAYRELERNLIIGEGRGEPVALAEITAAGFRLTRVRPLLGRTIVDADEHRDSPPVVVIGHDVWQHRFGGDSSVVGRTIRLGSTPHTIVGVMPEGFAFPVAQNLWAPLRLDPLGHGRREGPGIRMFARLSSGVSLDEAQAELTAVGRRASADHPDTHRHLRPRVMPYARSVVNLDGWRAVVVMSTNLPLIMLLVLVCGNVALLMFARAATREGEIVVRAALGAGRARIVMQLFAEALVLGGVATVVGLAAAGSGIRWVMSIVEMEFLDAARLPFWFQPRLSPLTVLYAAILTVLGAIVSGVVPALEVTRGVGSRLKEAGVGGGGLRFGGSWTAVIVAQVAVTVAFPVVAFVVQRDGRQIESVDLGFPTRQFLSVRLEMDREPPPGVPDESPPAFQARFRRTYAELERRLVAETGVVQIAFANRLPGMHHPHRLIELDEGEAAPIDPRWPKGYRISAASVGPGFLDAVSAPVLLGRAFSATDHAPDDESNPGSPTGEGPRGGPVIVNQSFVRLVMGGRNPIGRRLRYVEFEEWDGPQLDAEPNGPWYEIVGVVRDVGMAVGADAAGEIGKESEQGAGGDPKVAGLYHPVAPAGVYPGRIAVRVSGDPIAFGPRLRAIAAAVDPSLRLYDITPLDRVNDSTLRFMDFWFRLLLGTSIIALVLSLAGIYAVMSFTVSRRTREIGIRVALGADRRRVIASIFRRPLAQVGVGVAAGAVLVVVLVRGTTGAMAMKEIMLVAGYTTVMLAVCTLACIAPTRLALRVEPTEALRTEG